MSGIEKIILKSNLMKVFGKECNFIERIFFKEFSDNVKTILDIGCGQVGML